MKISKICVQNFRRLDKVQLEISDEKILSTFYSKSNY